MESPFKVTFDVTAQSESALESYCSSFLRERGWDVVPPNANWERVGDFIARLGICHQTLSRKLRPRRERPNVVVQYGEGTKRKRILAILSNPAFDAYCTENK